MPFKEINKVNVSLEFPKYMNIRHPTSDFKINLLSAVIREPRKQDGTTLVKIAT